MEKILKRRDKGMINIPSKIFDININDVEIGVSDIHLYSKNKIENA